MVFSTIIFLCVFLPISIIGYYLMPRGAKNYFLLLMSLLFYAWGEPRFVWIMLGSILCNYLFGLAIEKGSDRVQAECGKPDKHQKYRKGMVCLAVILNIGILFVFKYLTFSMETIHRFVADFPVLTIALPIGISFYTFQGLSYVIDVYRGEQAQRNPFKLALYIAMFPQLIAGPIVRYKDIKASLSHREHTLDSFAAGIRRFIIGLSKKAILANMTGSLADQIMTGDFQTMSAGVAWLGAIAYTLQIYLDFSGYSDMAIGLGRVFGFDFLENFNYPYISRSVKEFWRRWHMSLSGWFRDYLYIPLGGNRRGNVYLHLLLVFLATGIWHGAAWGFLLWGLWHGFFLIVERLLSSHQSAGRRIKQQPQAQNIPKRWGLREAAKSMLGWLYTMLVVVIGWVLFSLVDVRHFAAYLAVMFGRNAGQFQAFGLRYYLSNHMLFYLLAAIIVCIPWREVLQSLFPRAYTALLADPQNHAATFAIDLFQKLLLLALLALSFIFIINSTYNPFIYFRF